MSELSDRLSFLRSVMREVRQDLIHHVYRTLELKGNVFDNIVTDVDVAVQERLVLALSQRYPDTAFLNEEETTHTMSDRMWIIDPIDGTKNFVRRQEDYAISVAYYDHGLPVFGVVVDVAKDLWYVGIEGEGAWLNDQELPQVIARPLTQSVMDVNLKTLDQLRIHYGAEVYALSHTLFAHRSIGSGALSLCRIAAGKHDLYIGDHLSIWDYAAGAIILRAVGGIVTFPFADPLKPEPSPQLLVAAASTAQLQELSSVLNLNLV